MAEPDDVAFGWRLVDRGLLTTDSLERALALRRDETTTLRAALERLGQLDEPTFLAEWAAAYGLDVVDLETCPPSPETSEALPRSLCIERAVLPLAREGSRLRIALADPADVAAIDDVRFVSGCDVDIALAPRAAILAIARGLPPDTQPAAAGIPLELEASPQEAGDDLVEEAPPVVRLVAKLLDEAVARGASHVHFEPGRGGLRVRFRTNGLLQDVAQLPPTVTRPVVVRLKILARLDIADRRVPQWGRIRRRGTNHEFRVSTLPTALAEEHVLLEIRDAPWQPRRLDDLGFQPEILEALGHAVNQPGLLLVCGERRSGRTRTLLALADRLARGGASVFSVGHGWPDAAGVTRIDDRSWPGAEAIHALRAVLAHDADAVLLEAIHDTETARLAARASLEGQTVLFRGIGRTCVAGLARLAALGLEPALLAASLSAILCQAQLRRLCPGCSEPEPSASELANLLGHEQVRPFAPRGCHRCGGSGYAGRLPVAELLLVDESVRSTLRREETPTRRSVGDSLRAAALRLAAEGLVAVADALAVGE